MSQLTGYDLVSKEFSGNEGKDFRDTSLNDALAKEHSAHISGTNSTDTYEQQAKPNFGKLGGKPS